MLNVLTRDKSDGILDMLEEIKQSLVEVDINYAEPQEVN